MESIADPNHSNNQTTSLETLNRVKKVAVFLKSEPSFDEVVGGLALGKFLDGNNKQVRLICPNLPEYLKSIEGVERIEPDLGSPVLVIAFDYIEGDIEKISYKVDGDKFNLIINSKKGVDPSKMGFKSKVSEFDYFIFLGIGQNEVKDYLKTYPSLQFGEDLEKRSLHFTKVGEKSVAEQLVGLFVETNMKVDSKAAEWLFSGLKSAMSNFADPQSATAFEAAAQCVRWIKNEPNGTEAPESWLSPKIYKGSTAVD